MQEVPPAIAGRARPGNRPCGRRFGPCDLVVDESERAAGHRRSIRCRGVPRFSIPEGQDAFKFFRRANEERSRWPLSPGEEAGAATVAWSGADPKVRAWVEASGPALGLFLQGAGCRDGISRRPGEPYSGRYSDDLGRATWCCWHSWRAEGGGGRRSVGGLGLLSRGPPIDGPRPASRVDHRAICRRSSPRLAPGPAGDWAADRGTTTPQLRRALEEAVETRPRPEWHAFSLRVEYLDWMRQLETMRIRTSMQLQEERSYRLGDMELPQGVTATLYRVRRFLLREPERSRRAIRLLFANWLAQVEGPGWQRGKPDVFATFGAQPAASRSYPVSPEAPAGSRVLPPHEVATWLVTAYDLKVVAWRSVWPSVLRSEQAGYRELVVALAERTLSSRARGDPTLGGSPGRDLSPELARRRLARPGR